MVLQWFAGTIAVDIAEDFRHNIDTGDPLPTDEDNFNPLFWETYDAARFAYTEDRSGRGEWETAGIIYGVRSAQRRADEFAQGRN